jgi:hypothetical protein
MRLITITILLALFTTVSYGQCDTIANKCLDNISANYISDGQLYRALLYDDQVAEFKTTFYGGSKYRIAACSGFENGNLVFSIFDSKRNLLFTNTEYDNAPYWDFNVNSSMEVIIEAQLDLNKLSSGCAVLLIGFEK